MQTVKFKEKLQKFDDIPENVIQDILSKMEQVQANKKTILLEKGQVCEYLYFIDKGLARTFHVKEGKEYTTDIFIDGEFLVEFSSFVFRKPSHQFIELVEDTTFLKIHYDDLQILYKTYPIMERIGRLIAEYNYYSLSLHTYLLKFSTTAARYQYLFDNKIEIIRRAPIGIIASYLGMSIENLSRIRKKIG